MSGLSNEDILFKAVLPSIPPAVAVALLFAALNGDMPGQKVALEAKCATDDGTEMVVDVQGHPTKGYIDNTVVIPLKPGTWTKDGRKEYHIPANKCVFRPK